MPRFLSDEWIAAFDEAAATASDLVMADGDDDLIIEHVVTDVPGGGESAFHLRLSQEPAAVRAGRAADATVTFTNTYATAAAIASGEASAQAAFMAGQLRLGGRVDRLIAHHGALAGIDDVFSALRESTEY